MKLFGILFLIMLLVPNGQTKDEVIQCGNLIYAGTNTSRCFSDEFLSAAQRQTSIATERRFKSVKLGSNELFKFPFVMMTGEKKFMFQKKERDNLKKYLESGGFMLASAGCSSKAFDSSFRQEIKRIFGDKRLKTIKKDHVIYRTVKKLEQLKLKSGGTTLVEGLEHNGKIVLVYSAHGLNDTAHTKGCCCCGGNEINNSLEMNVNILIYALLH